MRKRPRGTLSFVFVMLYLGMLFALIPPAANGATSAWDTWKKSYDSEISKSLSVPPRQKES